MSWLDFVHGREGLVAVYDGHVPELREIVVQGILFHRNGPSITIGIELPKYPANPPKKWAAQGFNTVQLSLMLIDVADVTLSGWSNKVTGEIELTAVDGQVEVTLRAILTRFNCRAGGVYVEKLSAYLRAPDDAPL